jgi:hypothetical protein
MTPAQRRETSRQLRHDAHALIGAHPHPALDLRKAAPATGAKRYNEVRTHLSLGKEAPCTRPIERFGDIIVQPGGMFW